MSFLQSPTHELIIAAVAGGALATAAIYLLAGGPKKAHPALTAAPTDYTDFNERTATALAVARLRGCKDERLKTCLASIMKHLHDCVREIEPTEHEAPLGQRKHALLVSSLVTFE